VNWYGFHITVEFLVIVLIFAGIGFGVAKFDNPKSFRLRGRARLRVLRGQDPLFKFGLVGSLVIFLTIFFIYGIPYCEEGRECVTKLRWLFESAPNEVGDAMAGISSALAFLWIILTVMMQSKELKAQRSELKMTRGEHRRQREVSEANLGTVKHDSLLRDQQEAWRHFEALLYEFLYAVEWHRQNKKFCKWLFGKDVQTPTTKQGSDRTEMALDLHFQIRSRKKAVESGQAWKGTQTSLE